MRYLVMVCKPGEKVRRHECSFEGARIATKIYREWGWAVDVFVEVQKTCAT